MFRACRLGCAQASIDRPTRGHRAARRPKGRLRRDIPGSLHAMVEPDGHGLPAPLPGSSDRAALYRVAYEQGLRSLTDQVDELSGLRTRAVSYMAFIGTATAFLVTATLRSATAGTPFFVCALLATLFVAWATIQLGRTIHPGLEFTFRLDARQIIARWIDREVPAPSEADLLRSLSGWLSVYVEQNEVALKKVRWRFNQVVMCGGTGLLLWTVAIWAFGRVGVGG